jgi:RNA polymerase sigma-70 factor (ECF subfamily)
MMMTRNNFVVNLKQNLMSLSIQELKIIIDDCLKNSRQSQRKLYDIYSPFIYSIIVRNLSDRSLIHDVLSETFVKIFRDIGKYSYVGTFEGWIRRITINTIVDNVRFNKKHNYGKVEIEDDDILVNSKNDLSYNEILVVINTLPKIQKLVFNLFVIEGYSHKEIASLLEINESNSRWLLNDARKRLKSKLLKLNYIV